MYLRSYDYYKQIQSDNLNAIISNDTSIRLQTEMSAQAECISYLNQKYDVDIEFSDTTIWSRSVSYKALHRFYLDYPTYITTSTYAINSLVTYQGNCYIATATTTGTFDPTKWTLLGAQYDMFYGTLPAPYFSFTSKYMRGDEVFYKDKVWTCKQNNVIGIMPTDSTFGFANWGNGVAYSIPAATLPTNTTYFTFGDNRSQQLVMYCIDIVLYHIHSRISPRNIPQLRMDRYDRAIEWLKEAGGQNTAITAAIPLLVPNQGMRIRWSSYPRNINTY